MGISYKKGLGKIISAKNYVGIITMNNGTTIEILPKIQSDTDDISKAERLLVEMLRTLKDSPFKTVQVANVNTDRLDVFELFIRMFIREVFVIVKRGLKCNYEVIESNEHVFKGKVLFSEQIKRNHFHREMVFTAHDEYNINRVENRLIKSTLILLAQLTSSAKSKTDLHVIMNYFDEVVESDDVKADFCRYTRDRSNSEYDKVLSWCRIFLQHRSFTTYAGNDIACALLFPMEVLFESYVANRLRKVIDQSIFTISIQDQTYHLFDFPQRKFLMKPDIVIKRRDGTATYILDTKWKVLSPNKPNYGISQADMYQMYAYQKKYDGSFVTLIYPQSEAIPTDKGIQYRSSDNSCVNIHLYKTEYNYVSSEVERQIFNF